MTSFHHAIASAEHPPGYHAPGIPNEGVFIELLDMQRELVSLLLRADALPDGLGADYWDRVHEAVAEGERLLRSDYFKPVDPKQEEP